MTQKTRSIWMSTLAAMGLCLWLSSQTIAAGSEFTVANETISARFDAEPLTAVLDRIQSKMGFTYSLAPDEADREVTVTFDALSYEDALGRILKDLNYSLVFNSIGGIEHIHIVGEAGGTASAGHLRAAVRAPEKQLPVNRAVLPPPSRYKKTAAAEPDPSGGTAHIAPREGMVVPPKEEMVIVRPEPGDAMPYIPPREKMVVTKPEPGDGMHYIPPREKMVVTKPEPGDGMHYIPPKETSQVNNLP